ncbi:hypothetical protein IW141_003966 [Coemansia sp. RSA 355]|nr:hypothetical protein IW141_003966 [Coemansia sp. RSA 355]
MVLDNQGHDPLAYATEPDVAILIQDHRTELSHATTMELFTLACSSNAEGQVITGCGAVAGAGAPAGLPPLLPAQPGTSQVSSPAKAPATISSCINLAAHDANGGTLLHVAMQSNLEVLAHWAITKGVDIFARDTHGKLADTYAESAPIHELLAQAPMGNACTAQLSGHATKFSSELHKWTNYAGGWKSYWFELEDGVWS